MYTHTHAHTYIVSFPWISCHSSFSPPSLPVGLLDYILYPHRAVVSSYWSAKTDTSIWRGLQENVSYEFVLSSTAVSCISYSSFLDVLITGGRWPYSYYFVGYSFQDLFNIARSILVQLPSRFFSIRFVSVHAEHPYNKTDTATIHFILLEQVRLPYNR